MSRKVDLVLCGEGGPLLAGAVEAICDGQRQLVVMRASDVRAARRIRRAVGRVAAAGTGRVAVMTNVEVVCVDGIDGVEVVLVRHLRTGRIEAANASAFRSIVGSSDSARDPS